MKNKRGKPHQTHNTHLRNNADPKKQLLDSNANSVIENSKCCLYGSSGIWEKNEEKREKHWKKISFGTTLSCQK